MPKMEAPRSPSPPRNHFSRPLLTSPQAPTNQKVHVALGKSMKKTVDLLQWTFRRFPDQEICLLHVHQPSSTIPTPLGRLPASHANEEAVAVYRREEREKSQKLLSSYLSICSRAKVKATISAIESGQVHKGIVELVKKHGIRKLVMGAVPENFTNVQKSLNNAKYAAKNAPPFCEIWFINKGKHIWTREALEYNSFLPSMVTADESPRVRNWPHIEADEHGVASFATLSSYVDGFSQGPSSFGSSAASSCTYAEIGGSPKFDSEVEAIYYNQMLEARTQAEISKNEAFAEILKRRKLESEFVEAINKVQATEAAHAREFQQRKEAEETLRVTREEQEKLLEQREEVSRELHVTMTDVAILNSVLTEAITQQDEVAKELRCINMSLSSLIQERKKILRQKAHAMRQIEWWKTRKQGQSLTHGELGFANSAAEYIEFSLSDLQTATCNFAEGFKIGHGGYGCVYKGEIWDQSVAIKKLHSLNSQGKLEFQQQVQVLSKIKHPNMVTFVGACPEAWSLVNEYMPNGNIHDHLLCKRNTHPLTWKKRAQIAASISSFLLYLHSCKPEKIVHGDLKPENVLFDSEFNCKIGDLGIHRLVQDEIVRCPSFRGITETKDVFPYKDPELPTTRTLTTKSDIYSFGVIILQLLTGRLPLGLITEVRQAFLYGNMASVLDPSAGEWPTFVSRRLADFGLKCCEFRSQDRPELKPSIVWELEQLHLAEDQPVPSFFMCPILQEIMNDPHVTADGFTYEGESIKGWLKKGHETSPITNLKLSNLHLTPNHALRLAIQDWLCIC